MGGFADAWLALFTHWPGYVLTIDGDDRLTSLNRSTPLIDAECDLGRDLFDFVPAADQPALRRDLAGVRSGESSLERSTRVRFSDGSASHYRSKLIPLPERGVLIVTDDVTIDVQTKLALERSEQRFRALVENNRAAIALSDADGTTLYVSPAVEQLSGYTAAERVGRRPFDTLHPEDRAATEAAFARVRATPGAEVSFEFRLRHRDGTYRWIHATAKNLLDDPCVSAIVGNFHDITDSHELVEERVRSAEADRAQVRLRVLAKATHAFSKASSSPASLFDAVVHEVSETLGCACALSLICEDGVHFTTAHLHASDPAFLAAFREHLEQGAPVRIDAHSGMRHVVESGTPFFKSAPDREGDTPHVEMAPGAAEFARASRIKSVLVVPLSLHGRVIGALGLTRHGDAPALDSHDLVLAQSLAEHATLAIAAARLVEAAERELVERERMAARLRVLATASREFAEATGDLDQLLQVIARRLGDTVGDICVVRPVAATGDVLENGAVFHRDPAVVAETRELMLRHEQRVGEGLMGSVIASRRSLFLPTVTPAVLAGSTAPPYHAFIERMQVAGLIAVPLVCREQVIGVALLLRCGSHDPYTEDDLRLVESVADHAEIAIANARSTEAERAARAASERARDAHQASEAAHRLLFEGSPVPLLVYDQATHAILAANAAATRLYGYTRDELVRLRHQDLVVGDPGPAVPSPADPASDKLAVVTGIHARKDGTTFHVECVARPLEFGGRSARIAVITDVTARREAEEMRALLAAIVESSQDAIVSKRLDGTITSWNSAAERLFGYRAEEAIGQPIQILIPEARRVEERRLIERVERGERVDHYETVRRRRDGTEIHVSASLAPILDAAGVVVGVSKTARDLTLQRNAALTLRQTEEQLRQAQKMEAVGRLAAGVAHDFNNVLSVILSYSDLILGELGPKDAMRADLEEIRQAALRAADLTQQLLTFGRQQVVSPKVLDVNAVLVGLDKMLRRILGEDVELLTRPTAVAGWIFADPTNVEQIVMNLVVNARDAMQSGGTLTIATEVVELDGAFTSEHPGMHAGPHVVLSVTDTGEGMDAATVSRVFEPFFTTKGVGKGTGLGLSTVFGIAQQAGGCVSVSSEPSVGSTFRVYLPRVDAKEKATHPPAAPITLRGSETVLLVEDQEQVRAVAHGILERSGYRVLVATNPDEALLIAENHRGPIDVLLTDVVMPHMSGAELAKRVSLLRPEVKVLCMSGYTDDDILRRLVFDRELAFLQKPFTPTSLTRKLREVLEGTRGTPRGAP